MAKNMQPIAKRCKALGISCLLYTSRTPEEVARTRGKSVDEIVG